MPPPSDLRNHIFEIIMRSVLLNVVVVAHFVGCQSSPLTSFNSKALLSSLQPIQSIDIVQSTTGMITSFSRVSAGKKSLLVYLTHLGDLSSWELAQKLNYYMPKIKSAGLNLVAVAPGATTTNAVEFSLKTGLSTDDLYLDFDAVSYNALKFNKGFMPNANISPYLKLLPMLVGIQSEGTIAEVLRGYVGDKTASSGWIKSALRYLHSLICPCTIFICIP